MYKAAKPFIRIVLVSLLLVFISAVPVVSTAQNKKIAVFGSSVARGSGDTTPAGGYAGLLKTLMEQRGWVVVNVSRGGDNTVKIMPRFEAQLLPEKPGFVIIGLSLGNEGISSSSALNRERIFERFRSGMVHLIRLCRENGIVPVVVNCYARNDFLGEQYDAIKKMNLVINTWDVPSINALGTIDNGNGRWAEGYWHDRSHPNEKGHREIFYAFVPGLFDAIASGKKVPEKIRSNKYLLVSGDSCTKPLVFIPVDTIHSFTVSFLVKTRDDGSLAAVNGEDTHALISLKVGKIVYQSSGKEILVADTTGENNGWQYVGLSHRYASGLTSLYVNGKLAGTHHETLNFKEFCLGGSGNEPDAPSPRLAGYKELLIYRSALNADEAEALYYDQLLQSSLEIYAPLNDSEFRRGTAANNHAQSMSRLIINGDHLSSASEGKGITPD